MTTIFLGAPGVGKGTQAVLLRDHVGWVQVSTGDLLRAARREGTPLGRRAQGFMDAGELVPDDLILDLVRDHLAALDPDASILFDGFPRTLPQAEALDAVLAELGREVDHVLLLDGDDEELVKRLSGRRSCPDCGAVYNVHASPPQVEGICDRCGADLVQRKDDEADTVRRRLDVYRELTQPLIGFYRDSDRNPAVVDGIQAVETVHEAILEAIGMETDCTPQTAEAGE